MSEPVVDRRLGSRPSTYAKEARGRSGLARHVHRFVVVSYETVMVVVFSLPRFRLANRLKTWFLRQRGATVGRRVDFFPGVWISPGCNLVLGDDVNLSKDVIVTTAGGVSVGARTLVGFRSQLLSRNHVVPDDRAPIFGAGYFQSPVTIGADCWLGANVTVLPGVTIGDGVVVAANAIVSRDVPSWTVVAGIPARPVRFRPESGPAIRLDRQKDRDAHR